MIRFTCPTCRNPLTCPDADGGRKGPCPLCGQRLLVPLPTRPAATNKTRLGELPLIPASPSALAPLPPSPPVPSAPLGAETTAPPLPVVYGCLEPIDCRPQRPWQRPLSSLAALGLFFVLCGGGLGLAWYFLRAAPEKLIVGKWQSADKSTILDFAKDGTMILTVQDGDIGTRVHGSYRMDADGTLEIERSGRERFADIGHFQRFDATFPERDLMFLSSPGEGVKQRKVWRRL